MKGKRQAAIQEIVTQKKISTQEELVVELERKGFKVTQATVSRDLGELQLQKQRRNGRRVYILSESRLGGAGEQLKRLVQNLQAQIALSQNLVLIKTAPGGAQGLASALDQLGWPEILGTIAGDDTILIITDNKKSGNTVGKKLRGLIFEENSNI